MANRARQNRDKQLLASLDTKQKLRLICGDAQPLAAAVSREMPAPDYAFLCGGALQLQQNAEDDLWPVQAPLVQFPAPSALACSFDTALAEDVAEAVAKQCRENGAGLLLGPSLAPQSDMRSGNWSERFSQSARLTGEFAAAYVRGLRREDVSACLTDYGCAGGADSIDAHTLYTRHLEAARIALREKPAAVMCAADRINGCFAAESERLIRRALCGQFGFEGAVFQPYGGSENAAAAVAAGAGLQLPMSELAAAELAAALGDERIDETQLDGAALQAVSLLTDAAAALPRTGSCSNTQLRAFARRAAAQCMVLLKNENNLLPFTDGQPFAVIGAAAAQPSGAVCGSVQLQPFAPCSLLDALQQADAPCSFAAGYNADGSTNALLVSEAKQALQEAGRGVLVLGLAPGAESSLYGRDDLSLPEGMLKLADILAAQQLPLAVVLLCAAPVELPFEKSVDALLFAGACGEAAAQAAADLLMGRAEPSGKLAFSWPQRGEDTPLYPFGHGLVYGKVQLLWAAADKQRVVGERQKITVRIALHNPTARTLGKVLQLYVGEAGNAMQELAAFKKVWLLPGEHKTAEVEVPADVFTVYDPLQDCRRLAAGSRVLCVAEADERGSAKPFAQFAVQVSARDGYIAPPENSVPREPIALESAQPLQQTQRYTAAHSLSQLMHTLAGRALAEELSLRVEETEHPNPNRYLSVLLQLPVRLLPAYTGGAVSRKRVQRMLDFANRRYFRGIFHGIIQ